MTGESDDAPGGETAGATTEPDEGGDELPVGDPTWGPEPERTWATGERRPAPPTAAEAARLAADTGVEVAPGDLTCIRVALRDGEAATREDVLAELRTEPGIVAVSTDADCGPASPDAFDVLLAPEHDSLLSSSAISTLDRVDGVAFAAYPAAELAERTDAVLAAGDDDPEPDFEAVRAAVEPTEYDDVVAELDDVDLAPATGEATADDRSPAADGVDAALDGDDLPPVGTGDDHDSASRSDRDDAEPLDLGEPVDGNGTEELLDLPAPDAEDGTGESTGGPNRDPTGASVDPPAPDHEPAAAGDSADASMMVGDPAGAGPADADAELDPDAVLAALLRALDERTLREDELETLRNAVGISSPESLHARMDHLGNRVSELLAYREELEEFVDETDGGRRLLELEDSVEELSERVAAVEGMAARLDDVAELTRSLEGELDRQAARIEVLSETVAEREDQVTELRSSCEQLRERQAELAEVQGDLADELDGIAEELAALTAWRDRLGAAAENPE